MTRKRIATEITHTLAPDDVSVIIDNEMKRMRIREKQMYKDRFMYRLEQLNVSGIWFCKNQPITRQYDLIVHRFCSVNIECAMGYWISRGYVMPDDDAEYERMIQVKLGGYALPAYHVDDVSIEIARVQRNRPGVTTTTYAPPIIRDVLSLADHIYNVSKELDETEFALDFVRRMKLHPVAMHAHDAWPMRDHMETCVQIFVYLNRRLQRMINVQ